jgi:predicted DNA-binding transcriptional regulator YafY
MAQNLVRWEPAELAALEAAIGVGARDGLPQQAQHLTALRDKIGALVQDDAKVRIAPDLEGLCEGQGYVMRPGPRPSADPEVVDRLRWAILACRTVKLDYDPRGPAERGPSLVHPYGFLSGAGHYLVGFSERACAVHLYRLARIAGVELLDASFERDPKFDLRRYAENSFGIYQEEAVDVVWRFDPEVAEDAADFEFHPTQKTETLDDGSLVVRFRASGLLEMAWHLFRWGPGVEVLEPDSLREKLIELLAEALAAHAPTSVLR